jgi:peptidoglycan lytic transglycosylase
MMAALLLAVTTGAAERPTNTQHGKAALVSHRRHTDKAYQIGPASWYGKSFHGKPTASGEPYNMFEFTAAHMHLPLGTYVKVTNLKNDLWVIVRVNDRGPVPAGRIIDLSYGAAQMLKLRAAGVQKVRLDVVQPDTVAAAVSAPALPGEFVSLR